MRRRRERVRLTQVELARRLGVHPNSVARMERDEMTITKAMAIAITAVTAPRRKER